MKPNQSPEPWLRGTLRDVPAVPRAVLHALELAKEDLDRWCRSLSETELNARPAGLAPIAFHVRHIARSLDRLLSYAEGHPLSADQFAKMKSELDASAKHEELFEELNAVLRTSAERIRAFDLTRLDDQREVGQQKLPTTLGGLLVHLADHTQRHVGQAITTSKIVLAQRS
jgi:uncharacterized damage-inducible protein DinB